MFGTDTCPRCLTELSPVRAQSIPKVCNGCGHVLSKSEVISAKAFERQSLYWVVGSSIAIVLIFMHVVAWGGYSLEVIPLQVYRFIGIDSSENQERMAYICLDAKKLDCVESIYSRSAHSDPNGLVRLGKFQFNRMKYRQAVTTFQSYFANEGSDIEARFVYARALSESGNVDEAGKQYEVLLAGKPEVLQVTVAQNYVKLLVQHNRLEQALKVLQSIRKRGDSVTMFMDSEFKDIEQKLVKTS